MQVLRLPRLYLLLALPDMFGTQKVGLPTYWHNRVGLTAPEGAPSPFVERSTLDPLLHDIESLARS
jgi:hypothetical protein